MIVVIADDITGAAEIAGIACAHGLQTRLQTEVETHLPSCDVLVIAADTRSMTQLEAEAFSRQLAERLEGWLQRKKMSRPVRLFKKTDSALRGHVMAELSALLSLTCYNRAVFVPANPSKKRVIRQGIYEIDGKPINETDFASDPEFPAFSAVMTERFPQAAEMNILMPDAGSEEELMKVVEGLSDDTLPAGGADLWTAWIHHMGFVRQNRRPFEGICLDDILIVCGSTQSRPLHLGISIASMPVEVYDNTVPVTSWIQELKVCYTDRHALILTIPHHHLTGHEVAKRLRGAVAVAVRALMDIHQPAELVFEGGATAFACLSTLGWNDYQVIGEVAPGVVRMKAPQGTVITLKPGSYEWGPLFCRIGTSQE